MAEIYVPISILILRTSLEKKFEGNAVEDWNITVLAKGEAIIGLDGEKPFRFYIERFGWEYGAHF